MSIFLACPAYQFNAFLTARQFPVLPGCPLVVYSLGGEKVEKCGSRVKGVWPGLFTGPYQPECKRGQDNGLSLACASGCYRTLCGPSPLAMNIPVYGRATAGLSSSARRGQSDGC